MSSTGDHAHCTFVPAYLLQQVLDSDPAGSGGLRPAESCRATLRLDEEFRLKRATLAGSSASPATRGAAATTTESWVVYDAQNTEELPGVEVRRPGDTPTGDAAVDEAADGVDASLRLTREVFGRDSYDGAGATAIATVHYSRNYANAFWDGSQLVFGDGDGEVFERFTKAVDVLGHELAHAITEHSANLVYQGQPGALNESFSDVFAACLKQWLAGESAADADWLIGEGIFAEGVSARALRDMKAPGTAYDDPRLGKDPQPATMADYVETTDDNGGVHINSGIPNHAFQLAAVAIGGNSWEGAGPIWFAALTGDQVGPADRFRRLRGGDCRRRRGQRRGGRPGVA